MTHLLNRFPALLALLAFVLVGCDVSDEGEEIPTPFQSVSEIVQDAQNFSSLKDALLATDLLGALDEGQGEFTLFAPNDGAFAALETATSDGSSSILDSLLAENEDGSLLRGDVLSGLLTYHVVPGRVAAADLSDGQTLTTLEGTPLTVRIVGDDVYVGGAPIVTTDTPATNGIVHGLGQVLTGTLSVVDLATLSPGLSGLVEQLVEAELVDDLAGDPLTVFAPDNAALAVVNPFSPDSSLAEDRQTALLLYHVVSGDIDVFDVDGSESLTTLSGDDLTLFANDEDGEVTINTGVNIGSSFTVSNGVVHVVNQPLLGALNIVERASFTADLLTLADLVTQAELVEALSGEGPFTVFAPSNDAFANIDGEDVIEAGFLAELLQNHVVAGELRAADLSDGQTLTTLTGETLEVTIDEFDTVFVDGVPITTANVPVSNGVVHVTGGVLLQDLNIVERAIATPGLDELVDALVDTELAETLAAADNVTVFAPTDDAFAAAREALGDDFPEGDALRDVLLYHVVPAQGGSAVLAGDITDGLTVPTLLDGSTITFGVDDGDVFINPTGDDDFQAEISIVNVITSNGVVHVIDGVLLP